MGNRMRVRAAQSVMRTSPRKPGLASRTYCGANTSARSTPNPSTTSMLVRMTESAWSAPASSPASR